MSTLYYNTINRDCKYHQASNALFSLPVARNGSLYLYYYDLCL